MAKFSPPVPASFFEEHETLYDILKPQQVNDVTTSLQSLCCAYRLYGQMNLPDIITPLKMGDNIRFGLIVGDIENPERVQPASEPFVYSNSYFPGLFGLKQHGISPYNIPVTDSVYEYLWSLKNLDNVNLRIDDKEVKEVVIAKLQKEMDREALDVSRSIAYSLLRIGGPRLPKVKGVDIFRTIDQPRLVFSKGNFKREALETEAYAREHRPEIEAQKLSETINDLRLHL